MRSKTVRGARSWTDEQLIEAVKTSYTKQEVGRKLGLTTYGANSRTIKKHIERLNLDTSHFWNRNEQLKEARKNQKTMTLEEMFSINTVDRKHIKNTIIENKMLPYECSNCKINSWDGKPLSLHLDHINGASNDNRLENLRFLCPNCHSQTDTYCGKQLRNKDLIENKCIDCGVVCYSDSVRCRSCDGKYRKANGGHCKITWPPTQELANMVEELGYRETGRRLGVSDNSVKKRIKTHQD